MDVLEQFAGAKNPGLSLEGMRKGLVPEVGLEPT